MKKLSLLLLLLPILAFGQTTLIPDTAFEQALIDLGYDTGTPDGSVPTVNISSVTDLLVYSKNISDLTGIEDFTALTELRCQSNQLTSLDVSNNTALVGLGCNDNQLTSLDLSNNTALSGLACGSNQLTSLDVSNNTSLTLLGCFYNQLTSLDVSDNTALTELTCDGNQLTSLDVSNNTALTFLNCSDNQLTCLNVKNGNNTNMTYLIGVNNPNLSCIEVDDSTYSTANWTIIDSQTSFSEDCNYPIPCTATASWDCINNTCTDPGTGNGAYSTLAACQAACDTTATSIKEITKPKELLYITDILGRTTLPVPNTLLFYIYEDGSVEKRVQLER